MEKVLNPRESFIRNGFIEKDGEYLLNLTGSLIVAFNTACDLNGGIDGRKVLGRTIDMISKCGGEAINLQKMREEVEQDTNPLVHEMLTSKDINDQLVATLVYTDLVSRKVEKNVRQEVASNFIDKLRKSEKAYKDASDQLDTQKSVTDKAIKNEMAAKDELSRVKRRADKQQRVAEHKIAELEKEIEMLKAQLNK